MPRAKKLMYFCDGWIWTREYDSAIANHFASALASDANFRYAIYDPPVGQTFGNTIYKKGGSVLHMLRRVLGDAPFYAGLALYGSRYAYGTATSRDLQHAMEDASPRRNVFRSTRRICWCGSRADSRSSLSLHDRVRQGTSCSPRSTTSSFLRSLIGTGRAA